MNSDIRLAVSFRGHRKRKRLRLLLGPGSTDCLIDLWIATAMTHPSGVLQGMDEIDIALEAGWEDEPQKFVTALVECGFLEKDEYGAYALHDWSDHQGYAIHAERRKANARNAAAARWNARQEKILRDACEQHAEGNPPSPLPSPVPEPSPEPVPVPFHSSQPASAAGNAEQEKGKLTKFLFPENSDAYRLAVLMRDTLKINVPTLKEPNLQAWARSFDVALRNDGRMSEPHFVAEVIKWACSDSFWRTNIQSPEKLRKQFDQLTAKMESAAEKARTASKTETWKSPAQRRVEANQEACREAKRLLFGDAADAVAEVTHDAS
ncbi:Prophage LambdaSo, replication protein O (modular protein) [uncultured delta proteobacterium]|uniref:Prophage LambdaSo, replication protein O (Modular protein) n=1 Tax=uncultured delta proteobacterium TaxID=34034 RepID=A0A212JK46_9DELT|nr:Prophage LambdaSo, replication protein O (modular protein) [uncultured delta proteobacterium]